MPLVSSSLVLLAKIFGFALMKRNLKLFGKIFLARDFEPKRIVIRESLSTIKIAKDRHDSGKVVSLDKLVETESGAKLLILYFGDMFRVGFTR